MKQYLRSLFFLSMLFTTSTMSLASSNHCHQVVPLINQCKVSNTFVENFISYCENYRATVQDIMSKSRDELSTDEVDTLAMMFLLSEKIEIEVQNDACLKSIEVLLDKAVRSE